MSDGWEGKKNAGKVFDFNASVSFYFGERLPLDTYPPFIHNLNNGNSQEFVFVYSMLISGYGYLHGFRGEKCVDALNILIYNYTRGQLLSLSV